MEYNYVKKSRNFSSRQNSVRVTTFEVNKSTNSADNNFQTKIISIFIHLFCGSLCLWQLGLSIDRYFNQPVVSSVQPGYFNVYLRPPVTVCQSEFPIRKIHTVLQTFCDNTSTCLSSNVMNLTLSFLGWNLNDFWNTYSIVGTGLVDYQTRACGYAENFTECTEHDKNSTELESFHVTSPTGMCIGFIEKLKYNFLVAKTGTYTVTIQPRDLVMDNDKRIRDKQLFSEILLLFNSNTRTRLTPLKLLNGLRLQYPGRIFISILSVIEKQHMTTSENSCVKDIDAEYLKEIACVTKFIRERMPCALPFFPNEKPKLKNCETIDEITRAVNIAKEIMSANINFICPEARPCNDVVYKMHVEWTPTASYLKAEIRFLSNVKIVIKDVYIYGTLEFSTDVVGNLGFFLGLSLIGILNNGSGVILKLKKTKKHTNSCFVNPVKAVNAVALISCFCLCTSQIVFCLQRYFSYPTINAVSVERISSFKYPAVTFCSSNAMHQYYLKSLLKLFFLRSDIEPKSYEVMYRTPFKDFDLSLERIAFILGLDLTHFSIFPPKCQIAVNETQCLEMITETLIFPPSVYVSPSGKCETASLDIEYQNVGSATWVIGLFKGFGLIGNWTQFSLLVHSRDLPIRHGFYITANSREFIARYTRYFFHLDVNIIWTTKTISMNTTDRPCVTEFEAETNYNDCIDRHLEKVITCRLLFVNTKHYNSCASFNAYNDSLHKAHQWLSNEAFRQCPMQRVCEKINYVYVIEPKLIQVSLPMSQLWIKYGENVMETVVEKYSYSKSTFFADISNYLGFFLDLSLIGIFSLSANLTTNLLGAFMKRK